MAYIWINLAIVKNNVRYDGFEYTQDTITDMNDVYNQIREYVVRKYGNWDFKVSCSIAKIYGDGDDAYEEHLYSSALTIYAT